VKPDQHPAARIAVPAAADRAVRQKPLICRGCGQRIRTSKESYQEHFADPYGDGDPTAWHLLPKKHGPPP
jgi:hypothetical protein